MDQDRTPFTTKSQIIQTSQPNVLSCSHLKLKYSLGKTLWTNPSPNFPFVIRPVAILALGEILMDSTINPPTKSLKVAGIQLTAGNVNIHITRCLFDTKMAAILDGAGGASCHLCTSTQDHQLKYIDLIKQSLFKETDEEFLSLSSKD